MSLKVGVIGAGSVSYPHVHAYLRNKNIGKVVLCDINEEARGRLAKRYAIQDTTGEYREILDDRSVDLIDICLPPFLHHKVALQAFAAGKHVICEKPIALNLKEADEMIAASAKAGKRFFVSFNNRFMPANHKIKELLDKGEIGKPVLMLGLILADELERLMQQSHWKGTWEKAGGGALSDTGIHYVDIANYFFGKPKAVFASCKSLMIGDVHKAEDNALMTVEFESGTLFELVLSYTMTELPWSESKYIYGTKGTFELVDGRQPPLTVIKCEKKVVCDDGYTRCGETKTYPLALDEVPKDNPNPLWYYSIGKAVDHFVDCILSDKKPIVTAEDGRAALQVVLAAYESEKTGRRIEIA